MYKLVFFVPETHVEAVKTAVFAAGAGRIGNYDCCAWQTLGEGQFRPLPGSDPFLGNTGTLETVAEYRVEMVCADERIADALKALRQAHPYEEPAFDIWRLADIPA
ncbi:MAG: YqfO family protein [Cellvibrio sp.]|jgi:Uncharacterized protein conserved in bacteria